MRPARLERATYSFGGCHSIQLSYGRSFRDYSGASAKHNGSLLLWLLLNHMGDYEHEPEAAGSIAGCNCGRAD